MTLHLTYKKSAINNRILIAIAGPPGVGKSTFTEALNDLLNAENNGCCAILPMDGFHFDDIYLGKMGWRSRKGAPHTFDVGSLSHLLKPCTTIMKTKLPYRYQDPCWFRRFRDVLSKRYRIFSWHFLEPIG